MRLGIRIGPCIHQEKVRAFSPHDETFLPVDDKMIPFVLCSGGGAEKVGTASWFGKAFRCKLLPFEQGFDIRFLLVIPSVQDNGITDQFRPHPERTGENIPQNADLFHDHAGGYPVHAPAAPLFRVPAPHEIAPSCLGQKLFGKPDLVRVHIQDHLSRDRFDKIPDLVSQFQLFRTQGKIKHGTSCDVSKFPKPVVFPKYLQFVRHGHKLFFRKDCNTELLCFLQFSARIFPGDHEIGGSADTGCNLGPQCL